MFLMPQLKKKNAAITTHWTLNTQLMTRNTQLLSVTSQIGHHLWHAAITWWQRGRSLAIFVNHQMHALCA